MRTLKKMLEAFLAVSTAAVLFFGCSVSSVSNTSALPGDGIIKESVFESAKKDARILTFQGKSGEISYSWFFDGASISSPAAQNLKVDISDAGSDLGSAVVSSNRVKLHFHEQNLIQAKTSLKIDFPTLWGVQKVRIYRKTADAIQMLRESPLNNDKTSSVLLPIDSTMDDLYLAAVDSSFHEDAAQVVSSPSDKTGDPASAAANQSPEGTGSSEAEQKAAVSGAPAQNKGGASGKAKSKTGSPSGGNASSKASGKDRYLTDPTPPGKPKPVEPQDVKKNTKKAYYCTLSIDCKTILNNMDRLNKEKQSVMPPDGIIMKPRRVLFYEGESVFDILLRETKKESIQMEYRATPMYNSNYIEGIHNLYEFDCGELSGWMYKVNGWYPNYGCSRYLLKDGDVVDWRFTCDLGRDVGCDWDVSKK